MTPGILKCGGDLSPPDEEIFAPILQVRFATTFDAAIDLANNSRFGLAGGLLCDDPEKWDAARSRLKAGVLNWNRPTTGASGALPFGGPGLSGNLRPSAYYAADYAAWPMAMQTAPKAVAIPVSGLPTSKA
jgi:succinylglutamic semialdehyde dehydrogenase